MTGRVPSIIVGNVLVLAPFGRDAQVLSGIVEADKGKAVICETAASLAAAFDDDTTAIILTEEGLQLASDSIKACLDRQPTWSDIPVIILSGGGGRASSVARWEYFAQFGNATLLERPLEKRALQMALRSAGRARSWQYIVRDQLAQLETQSRDLERRVAERSEALRIQVEERQRVEAALNATQRLEAVGRLTGGVAHDFNNLLQVVAGATALLRRLLRSERTTAGLLDTIDRAGEKGSKLTHQLLAFARKQSLNVDSLDVGRLLTEMVGLLQQSVRERVGVDLVLAPDLWPVPVDSTQLEVALLNLAVNAKDAMPAGGRLTVSARNVALPDSQIEEAEGFLGDFVLVSVADTGAGMSPEVAQRAFEPFFTTKPVGGGTGLGLSQVYGFATQSRGTAWIRTGPAGTEVSMLLPRSSAPGVFRREPQSVANEQDKDPLSGVRILLVEDDKEVGEITTRLLEDMGCLVHTASDADEAIGLDLTGIDLVMSDVAMPGSMDGIELAQQLSKRAGAPPILLVTGYAASPERVEGMNVRVLSKPYSPDKLQSTLRTLLKG